MAQSSPSEFLTFYRTIRTTTTFSQHASRCLVRPATTSRPFSSSIQQYQQDLGPNKDHTVDKAKKDNLNVQTDASKKGTEHRSQDTGGHATEQRDSTHSTEKANKENPKAPKPIIGMQDERGGKGIS